MLNTPHFLQCRYHGCSWLEKTNYFARILKSQRNPKFSVSLKKHHQSVPDSRVSNEASELEPEATEINGVDTHDPRQLGFSSKGLLAPVEQKIS